MYSKARKPQNGKPTSSVSEVHPLLIIRFCRYSSSNQTGDHRMYTAEIRSPSFVRGQTDRSCTLHTHTHTHRDTHHGKSYKKKAKEIFTLDYTCSLSVDRRICTIKRHEKSSKNHSQKFVVSQSIQLYNKKSCRSI